MNKSDEQTNGREENAEDDDSSDDEFQAESNALHKVSCYIDSDDINTEDIFVRFGRGVGSYVIIPAQQNDKSQYNVTLVVHTQQGLKQYPIGLVNKKGGVHFRLTVNSNNNNQQPTTIIITITTITYLFLCYYPIDFETQYLLKNKNSLKKKRFC
ncbi:hypothetical protein RFI_15305 [Reticulomyxa filosa]|uniref:Uncharacterized protein n=1 Tax=Reticulomyxa filosa TaxID=46433 RepID=X6N9D6_RETFI|nr:hypothetical protein RFI_15305 [Reticulomyxa filosa]|eukprot:ETO21897.1 hypothetical protein RFI_15305 [Reticulomyxa filosa]